MAAPQIDPAPVVLVVDDEPMVLKLMERALESAGYRVFPAGDGLKALALAAELPTPPAAVVTDLRMEPIDGASLARLLRVQWPDTPLLFVSGYGPAVDFGQLPGPLLSKPFDTTQLIQAIAQLLTPRDGARWSS